MYRPLTHYVREPEAKRVAASQEQIQQEALLQHRGVTFFPRILPVVLLDCVNHSNTVQRICTKPRTTVYYCHNTHEQYKRASVWTSGTEQRRDHGGD